VGGGAPLAVAVPGATLAATRWSGEGPLVVLLHAGVADRRAWTACAELVSSAGADVVAYDRRGFGDTTVDDPAAPFSHLDDLLAVLDAAGGEDGGRAAWLVGNSMGGALALDAALLAPDRVAGLVLVAPAVSGAPEPDEASFDAATARLGAAIDAAEDAGDVDGLNALEVHLWLDGPGRPEGRVGDPPRALALDMNRRALTGGLPEDAGESGVDAWGRLDEVAAPAVVVWGELDASFSVARTCALAERLPDVRETHALPGVAHLPALEAPDVVARIIAGAVGLSH